MIHNVYNEILFVGDAISARDLRQIYDHEIIAVVDLAANEPPASLGRDTIYCRFPLSDDGSNDGKLLTAAILCLGSLLEREFRTLVACSAGMSRSPVIAAAAISVVSAKSITDVMATIAKDLPLDVSPTLFASVQHVHRQII